MTLSAPKRRPLHALAAALVLLALAMPLALSPQASAQTRKGACKPSAAHHVKHGAQACAKPRHKTRPHARANTRGRHAKHKPARSGHRPTAKPQTVAGRIAAACEDGSTPQLEGDGSFSCGDGSEPGCESGAATTPSGDGSTLLCDSSPASSSGLPEAVCLDGNTPLLSGDGSFSCQDGSEPTCEPGASAAPSSDGSVLLCEAPQVERASG